MSLSPISASTSHAAVDLTLNDVADQVSEWIDSASMAISDAYDQLLDAADNTAYNLGHTLGVSAGADAAQELLERRYPELEESTKRLVTCGVDMNSVDRPAWCPPPLDIPVPPADPSVPN